jgi:[ribosomal protein S5]-alanine N-acetyltransferase
MHPEPHFQHGGLAVPKPQAFTLRRPGAADVAALVEFQRRNYEHFTATNPRRPANFLSAELWLERIEQAARNFAEDRGVSLYLFDADARAVGLVSLMHFVRGALQGCELGYAIDAALQGTGLMHWAVSRAVEYAFGPLNLHRIQANHLPENVRSARLLARLGFRREGHVEKLLLIDGVWRDQVRNALLNDAWRPKPGEEFMLAKR